MEENQVTQTGTSGEKEIGWLDLLYQIWAIRMKIIKWGAIGAVVGLFIGFSIPKEYTATAKLAPEAASNRFSGSFAAIAAMAGINNNTYGGDAVEPVFYPDVLSSVPFITGLFNVEVETKKTGEKMTFQEYANTMKAPWWHTLKRLPFKILGLFRSSPSDDEGEDHVLNTFQLTRSEEILVRTLKEKIKAEVDPKTDLITITVTMQDPLVSAMLADTVVSRLQDYITAYRTNKARTDLAYAEKINAEARENYYLAQKELADYSDRNQGIATQSARITRDRLENEAALAFTLYNQTAQRVQAALAMVQANTPVYAIVSPPTVPLRPSYPSKFFLMLEFAALGFVVCVVWLLIMKPAIEAHKKSKTKEI